MTPKTPNTELIDYQFKVMNERLDEHQDYTKSEFKNLNIKIDKFIDSATNKFASKEEHKDNSEKIKDNNDKIDKLHESVSSINLRIALAT
jgi:hypothetical protein